MYKSKLQELCHHSLWNLPEYLVTKNGPGHNPNFGASVTVNGVFFHTQTPVKSSKMAQNDVAKLALDYFSTEPFQQTTPTAFQLPPQPLMPESSQQPSLLLQQQHEETSCFITLFPQPSMLAQSSPQPFLFSSLGSLESTDLNDNIVVLPISAQIVKDEAQSPAVNAVGLVVKDYDAHKGSLESTYLNDNLAVLPISPQIVKDEAQSPSVNAVGLVVKDYDAHNAPKRMYKNVLQSYVQKKNLKFPVYSCEREGPPHDSRFKCNMTMDGKTYISDVFFSTIKEAENDVARVALTALSQFEADELIQDDSSLYKNLLQELAQKEKLNLPIYKTKQCVDAHVPNFISTVEIEGDAFTGQASKTKKQAEISAAEAAYHAIRKGKLDSLVVAPTSGRKSVPPALSCNLQPNITSEPQKSIKPNPSINLNSCLETVKQAEERGWDYSTTCDRDSNINHGRIQNAHLSSSASKGTGSKRICIYPREPNMTYPEGSVVLPMSDDKWVALSLSGNQN